MQKIPRWLVATILFLIVVAGLVWYGIRLLQQPAIGVVSNQLSPRAAGFVAPPTPDSSEQSVQVHCFSLTLPIPVTNLKTSRDLNDYSSECVVKGSIEKPRSQFTISAKPTPNLLDLSEEPGVMLRLQDDTYTPVTMLQLSQYQNATFASNTEITAFWLNQDTLYVVSLYSAARVSEEITAVHAQFVEEVLRATIDG